MRKASTISRRALILLMTYRMIDLFHFQLYTSTRTHFRASIVFAAVINGSSGTHTSEEAVRDANVFPILDKSYKKLL